MKNLQKGPNVWRGRFFDSLPAAVCGEKNLWNGQTWTEAVI